MDGYQLKKIMNDLIDFAYSNEDPSVVEMYKWFHISIIDKQYKSKHGDYNIRTKNIRLFNVASREPDFIVKTAIHELAHHVDFCKRKTTDHQKPFYEVYRQLLYAGLDMGLFDKEAFLNGIEDSSDYNKVKKMLHGYEPREVGYKSGLLRVDVKNGYAIKDDLKQRGYFFDAMTKNWYKEVPEEDVSEEEAFLKEKQAEYSVRDVRDVTFHIPKILPKSWCGHVFTEEERETLASGGSIYAQDFWSEKKRKHFSCSLSWENGKLKPDFNTIRA